MTTTGRCLCGAIQFEFAGEAVAAVLGVVAVHDRRDRQGHLAHNGLERTARKPLCVTVPTPRSGAPRRSTRKN
jgi:hypothetical protein